MAEEDWEVANQLIASDKIRHGLFFLHLSLEKILKAHVCHNTKDIAPRVHNLISLSELSGISFEQRQTEFLSEINPFNNEGCDHEMWRVVPSREEDDKLIQKVKVIYEWLKNQL